jgi:hypothetical protein
VIKVATLFLVVIVVLAMFGKLGWLGALAPKSLRRSRNTLICKDCRRHIIGTKGCDCGQNKKPKG